MSTVMTSSDDALSGSAKNGARSSVVMAWPSVSICTGITALGSAGGVSGSFGLMTIGASFTGVTSNVAVRRGELSVPSLTMAVRIRSVVSGVSELLLKLISEIAF